MKGCHMNEKYIMFSRSKKGRDGYRYIANVKYKIQKETGGAFYLAGKVKKKLNRFIKAVLGELYVVGDIVND